MLGKSPGKKDENPQTGEDVMTVTVAYNLKTNDMQMKSGAPTLILLGMLEMAKVVVTKNLVLGEVRKMALGQKPQLVGASADALGVGKDLRA